MCMRGKEEEEKKKTQDHQNDCIFIRMLLVDVLTGRGALFY